MNKLIRTAINIGAVIAISIISSKSDISNWHLFWPAIAIFVIEILGILENSKLKYAIIKGQLNLLYNILEFPPNSNPKCTFHIPKFYRYFYQAINYIPNGAGEGRFFSKAKGIIGRSFKEKETLVENFKSSDDFHQKMVSKYNYKPKDLGKRDVDRRSYLSIPIFDMKQKIIGLVYFDSLVEGTFIKDNKNELYDKINRSCESIKTVLQEYY